MMSDTGKTEEEYSYGHSSNPDGPIRSYFRVDLEIELV